MSKPVSVITPSGDRPECFELLRRWMAHQTLRPAQWVVVDDGKVPMQPIPEATLIRREPRADDPSCTLGKNLEVALTHVLHDKIIIMEDDDWYGPTYLQTLADLLDEHELVGIWGTNYYDLSLPGYREMGRPDHASMSQTGFRRSFIPKLLAAIPGDCSVDLRIWFNLNARGQYVPGKSLNGYLIPGEGKYFHCSFKNMPGRRGAGCAHNSVGYTRDTLALDKLKSWCLDVEAYSKFIGREKLVVYTAIAGGGRDELQEPEPESGVDYVCFTDQPFKSQVWDIRPFTWKHAESVRTAKHPKINPHQYFPDHQVSVWVDGNFKPKANIREIANDCLKSNNIALHRHYARDCLYEEAQVVLQYQQDHAELVHEALARYKAQQMPRHGGLSENGIIFRRHHDASVKKTMNLWWQETCRSTSSDQITLAYALWSTKLWVTWLPGNVREHPSFQFKPHGTIYWGAK